MTNSTDVRQADAAHGREMDPRLFREVMGGFASGIVVVAGMVADEPVGLTCQSFTSLSMDPPLIAFCPALSSVTWRRIRPTGAFCVNVLAAEQRDVSGLFGQRRDDKFEQVPWRRGVSGAPLLDGAAAHIECEIAEIHPGGDHEIVVGRVVALTGDAERMPLLYHRGRYGVLAP
ncbi:flavin reductase family protein [Actinocorallia herbida]|nr:flavin reductase family protein [Actinocorallia herbida]